MNTRITFPVVASLLLLGALATGVLQGQIAPQGPTLTVFFTGDHDAEITSCGCPKADYGGVTRRAAFLDTLRASNWEFLNVDAGDLSPIEEMDTQNRLKIETLARSMSLMQYHGITLGDHDLKQGPEFVQQLVGWLEQPVLATNYDLPDGQSERSRVVRVRDKRIGLVAFLDRDLLPDSTWVTVEPWEDQRAHVTEVHAASDLLVALAHIPDDLAVERLIGLYPEIDLIVAAHEGNEGVRLHRSGNTYVAWCAGRGRHLGRVEIAFKSDGSVRRMDSAYFPVVKEWGRRPRIDSLLTSYYAEIRELVNSEEFLAERLQSLEEPEFEYVGNETCISCHDGEGVQWATTLHAHAKETLVREEKDHDPECQVCHTTGFGYRTGFTTPATTPELWNVGCESCHGPGAAHVEDDSVPYGAITQDACLMCHTTSNSPDFDYSTYLPKVVHEGNTAGGTGASGH